MKIRFLGTGAAEGVPAVFCSCENCRRIRVMGKNEYRTRAQVYIDGTLSVDFPPEAYAHALNFGVEYTNLKYILVTHSHMDHFYAHDFILRGYKYAQVNEPNVEIFGNKDVIEVFSECTAREMREEVAQNFRLHTLKSYQKLTVGDYKVLTIPAQHSKTEDCLLYYIERSGKSYLHLYDTGRIEEKAYEFLKENGAKADAVALDCTFVDRTAGDVSRHMGVEDGAFVCQKLKSFGVLKGDAKIILTHFSHNGNPTRERLKKIAESYGFTAAYDGYETEI